MNLIKRSFLNVSAVVFALAALGGVTRAQDWQARHAMSPAQFQSTFADYHIGDAAGRE